MSRWWDMLTGRSTTELKRTIVEYSDREREEAQRVADRQAEERARDRDVYMQLQDQIMKLQIEMHERARREATEKRLRPMRHKRPATPSPRIKR
jgi:hypothetical protein